MNKSGLLAIVALASILVSCVTLTGGSSTSNNPLLKKWSSSETEQGFPPFDKIKTKHFKPALEQAMKNALAANKKVGDQTEAPTFQNTIIPLQKSSLEFEKVMIMYGVWQSALSNKQFKKLEKEMAPKLAEFGAKMVQNAKLFKRIETLHKNTKKLNLNAEQSRLVWSYYTSLIKDGAALNENEKKRVAELNKKHAELTTAFTQNMQADEENAFLEITDKAQLKGLPDWLISSAKKSAQDRKLENSWVINNTRSSMQPFVTYSADRALRKKAFEIWTQRGDMKNANNNNQIIRDILDVRAQRTKIFKYPSYAHWQLTDKMAKTPATAMKLLMKVWKPAVAQVKKDVREMTKLLKQDGLKAPFQPWDYRYYAEKLRQKKYNFDVNQLKPYLQLPKIQKAMFWVAKQLYGFEFEPLNNVPVYHKDVTVFVVKKDSKPIGYWYFDPYARKGKRSGAWMNAYRIQHRLNGKDVLPIVSNNSNFIKAAKGQPSLLSWDDASTMFHEFGHALHGLSSNVTYPSLAGTRTARDFVEFPSQIHEDWLSTPEVLKFLTNNEGKALPSSLVKKLKTTSTFNEGFATVEYLSSALIDMKVHSLDHSVSAKDFERTELKKLGMPKEIVMRHRMPHFAHIFAGEGYSAGYYSYLWSDVLRHDAFKAFNEAGGPYDKSVARKFQKEVLSVGNTISPEKAYKNFRGRGPNVRALLKSKGFQ